VYESECVFFVGQFDGGCIAELFAVEMDEVAIKSV
jgi:hypothetical protein